MEDLENEDAVINVRLFEIENDVFIKEEAIEGEYILPFYTIEILKLNFQTLVICHRPVGCNFCPQSECEFEIHCELLTSLWVMGLNCSHRLTQKYGVPTLHLYIYMTMYQVNFSSH